jgi:hypothetical protein
MPFKVVILVFLFNLNKALAQDEITLNLNNSKLTDLKIISIKSDSLIYEKERIQFALPLSDISIIKLVNKPPKKEFLLSKIYRKTNRFEKKSTIEHWKFKNLNFAVGLDLFIFFPNKATIQLNSKRLKDAILISYLSKYNSYYLTRNLNFEIALKHYFHKVNGFFISTGYTRYEGEYIHTMYGEPTKQLNFALIECGYYWRSFLPLTKNIFEFGLSLSTNIPLDRATALYSNQALSIVRGASILPNVKFIQYLNRVKN